MQYKKFFSIFLFLLMLPFFTSAHLAEGQDVIVGDYLIDLGYEPAQMYRGNPISFSLNLVSADKLPVASVDDAWVRMKHGDVIVFSGTLHAQENNILFQYTFPDEGEYDMAVRFMKDGDTVVQTNFVFDVAHGTAEPAEIEKVDSQLYMIAIFLVLLANGLFIYWYTKVKGAHKITR